MLASFTDVYVQKIILMTNFKPIQHYGMCLNEFLPVLEKISQTKFSDCQSKVRRDGWQANILWSQISDISNLYLWYNVDNKYR